MDEAPGVPRKCAAFMSSNCRPAPKTLLKNCTTVCIRLELSHLGGLFIIIVSLDMYISAVIMRSLISVSSFLMLLMSVLCSSCNLLRAASRLFIFESFSFISFRKEDNSPLISDNRLTSTAGSLAAAL